MSSSSSSESGSGRKRGKGSSSRKESGEKTVEYFHSVLSKDTVISIYEKYLLPRGKAVVPDDDHRANEPPEGYATVYEACLECGLRFPLPPPFVELLDFFQLPLGQVTPNSWRHLSAFAAELRRLDKDLSLRAILNFFQFKRKGSWFYLIPLQPFRAFCKTKWPKWQNRFFFYNRTAAPGFPWRGPKSVIPHPRLEPLAELDGELNKIPIVRKQYTESELVKGDVVFDISSSDEEAEVYMLNKATRKSSESKEPERPKTTSSASDAERTPKRQKTSSDPKKPESTSAKGRGKAQKPPRAPEKDVVLAPPSEHICEPFLWPTDFAERNDMLSKLVAVELSKASNDYAEMQRKLAAACHRAEQAEANFEKARAARISAQDEAQFAKNQLVIQREQTKRRDAAAVVAQGEALRVYTEKLFLSSQFSAFVGSLVRLIADKGEQGADVVLPLYSREIAARLQNLPLLEELASSSVLLSADRVRSCRADRDENLEAIFASVGPVSPASTYNGEGEAEPLEREAEVDQAGHPEKEADQEAEARPAGGEAEAEVAQEKEAVPDRGAGDEAGGV